VDTKRLKPGNTSDQLFGHMSHRQVRVFFFIRLKSKEKISAILATKKSKFFEELVEIVQYPRLSYISKRRGLLGTTNETLPAKRLEKQMRTKKELQLFFLLIGCS